MVEFTELDSADTTVAFLRQLKVKQLKHLLACKGIPQPPAPCEKMTLAHTVVSIDGASESGLTSLVNRLRPEMTEGKTWRQIVCRGTTCRATLYIQVV